LKGTCISKDFGDYTYEYCFLDKAHQISKKDGSRTSLGNFQHIVTEDLQTKNQASGVFVSVVEEEGHEEPLSGVSLKHEHGTRCWNGPERSVEVGLYCAQLEELRSVSETEKCVYKFEVGTAAVCEDPAAAKGAVKDEL
jgi:protein kinase C substrate 80K-H